MVASFCCSAAWIKRPVRSLIGLFEGIARLLISYHPQPAANGLERQPVPDQFAALPDAGVAKINAIPRVTGNNDGQETVLAPCWVAPVLVRQLGRAWAVAVGMGFGEQ